METNKASTDCHEHVLDYFGGGRVREHDLFDFFLAKLRFEHNGSAENHFGTSTAYHMNTKKTARPLLHHDLA